ncbi:MAG: hypothetical protein QME64_10615 [bacterium]|nr:hypothetical protein [bacterium]
MLADVLKYVQSALHYDAVGIRLRDGEDYPYYMQHGFSADFLEAERYLCARDTPGELLRNASGKPILECMSGNIISGRTDPAKPYFTPGGSFWTNSTTDLLASTTEADRQALNRNKCNSSGYESVALIPIRVKDEIIGLLQLNDRKRNRFSLELIHFFEGMTPTIGIMISRREAEEKLQQSYAKSRRILAETIQAIASVLETRDPYTAGHERRDAQLVCMLAQEVGLSEDQIEGLRLALFPRKRI